jgi:FkbM family methyltransferase|tara:strand:+ start:3492 stop:4133 length:642 start_codon:yes stop_codon:yes gene_type:complete
MNNVFFSKKYQAYVRENTLDEYIFGEISSAYKDLEIKKGDVVLDLGANIGAFAKQAAEKDAIVHCYEPEPSNFTLLQLNSPNTYNHKKAVVGKQNGKIKLFINSKRNKGIHMIRPVNGRESIEVETVSFGDLINEIKPNKIKIDVEGAEYDFLPYEFPSFVERLVMEIHFQYDPSWRKLGREVHENMIKQGFSSLKEFKDTGKNWHIIGAYVR